MSLLVKFFLFERRLGWYDGGGPDPRQLYGLLDDEVLVACKRLLRLRGFRRQWNPWHDV